MPGGDRLPLKTVGQRTDAVRTTSASRSIAGNFVAACRCVPGPSNLDLPVAVAVFGDELLPGGSDCDLRQEPPSIFVFGDDAVGIRGLEDAPATVIRKVRRI
jgi:hypothetical protein